MMERQIAEAEEQLRALQDERDQLEQDMEDNQVIYLCNSIINKIYLYRYFRLIIGLANAIDKNLRLTIRVLVEAIFNLKCLLIDLFFHTIS